MPSPLSPKHRAFGRAVPQLRTERDVSQEALGHETGMHRNYIGGVERGELNPSLTSINKFAHGLGVRASQLLALAKSLAGDASK